MSANFGTRERICRTAARLGVRLKWRPVADVAIPVGTHRPPMASRRLRSLIPKSSAPELLAARRLEPATLLGAIRVGHDRGGGGKVDDYQHVLRMHPQTPVVHGCAGISGD